MYSTSKQYRIGVNPKFYFFDSKMYFDLPLSYGYSLDRLYGIGPDTEVTGNEAYIKKYFTASLTLQVPPVIFSADRTGNTSGRNLASWYLGMWEMFPVTCFRPVLRT